MSRTSASPILPKVGSFTDFGDSAHFGFWDPPGESGTRSAPRAIPRSEHKTSPLAPQLSGSPKSPLTGSPTSPLECMSTSPSMKRSTVTRGDNVWHAVFNPGTNKAMDTKGSSKFDRPSHKGDRTVWDMYLKANEHPVTFR
mmetsp:Transcript_4304/g.15474  ORF Transcript_4304/g.15474 Transcript_4304/m.15474 type:complete len:141 (-) Transcript_4304:571-993(-)